MKLKIGFAINKSYFNKLLKNMSVMRGNQHENLLLSISTILILLNFSIGCTTLKKWMGDDDETTPVAQIPVAPVVDETIRFSENPNIGTFNDRRYKRATRKTIEEDSDVGSRAGSLWNTEGPSSYLFTQNKLHREGDLLNIKLEGNAKTQMETKIQVVKKLLARLEIVPTVSPTSSPNGGPLAEGGAGDARAPASVSNTDSGQSSGKSEVSGTATGKSNPAAGSINPLPNANSETANSSELNAPIQVDSIPTRVTERMADGNYRVKGQQSFMIGKKEFRVIIIGLVRPEDFTDEGMGSNKLLDPQLDIVSLRRSLQ